MIDLMLENFVVRLAPRRMSRQRQCSNRIAVVGKVPRNEILPLRLILLVPVLKSENRTIIDNLKLGAYLASKFEKGFHCLRA
jgi:hypothetical protein